MMGNPLPPAPHMPTINGWVRWEDPNRPDDFVWRKNNQQIAVRCEGKNHLADTFAFLDEGRVGGHSTAEVVFIGHEFQVLAYARKWREAH